MASKIDSVGLRMLLTGLSSLVYNDSSRQMIFKLHEKVDNNMAVDVASLYINGIPWLIELPLQTKEIRKLSDWCLPPGNIVKEKGGQSSCDIDGSRVAILPSLEGSKSLEKLQRLTYNMLEKLFDIDFTGLKFDIMPRLERLVICCEGETYQNNKKTIRENSGKFGTMFLQIPVQVDEPAGSLSITTSSEKTAEYNLNTNSSYSVVIAAGPASDDSIFGYTIKSAQGEMTAILVFSLIWNDYLSLARGLFKSHSFPQFLISTHKLKEALRPWEVMSTSTSDEEKASDPNFFCYPITGGLLPRPTVGVVGDDPSARSWSHLKSEDRIVARSLMSITSIDVHCAVLNGEKPALKFRLKQWMSSTNSIKDNLSRSAVSHINMLLAEAVKNPQPVIVFRPRNPHLLFTAGLKKSPADLFLDSLVEHANSYSYRELMEKPMLREVLLRQLDQLVGIIERDATKTECQSCLISKVFDVCLHLKAEDSIQKLSTFISNQKSLSYWFDSDCKRGEHSADTFTLAIWLADGWRKYPEILRNIINQLLKEKNFHIVFEIGLNFSSYAYSLGAQETLSTTSKLLDELRDQKPERIREVFDKSLVILAAYLTDESDEGRQVLDKFVGFVKYLIPGQQIELIQRLHDIPRAENSNHAYCLRKLGHLIGPSNFHIFKSHQFLKLLDVYCSMKDESIGQALWATLCSQCIQSAQASISNSKSSCLFCDVLFEKKTFELRAQVLADLANVSLAKDALMSSLKKFETCRRTREIVSVIEYIECILLLETSIELSSTEIVPRFSTWFSHLDLKTMCELSNALFESNFRKIMERSSTLRRMFESLLKLISGQLKDVEAFYPLIVEQVFQSTFKGLAWFGDLNIVKHVLEQLRTFQRMSAGEFPVLVTIISKALFASCENCDAATSLLFNRTVFNYLMLEWLKTLKWSVKMSQQDLVKSTIDCFTLFAKAERNFIDSCDASIVTEWGHLLRGITIIEVLEIQKGILETELAEEGPSLKKFPPCWQVLSELGRIILTEIKETKLRNLLSSRLLTSAMQSFLWIGEENGIAEFTRFLCHVPCSNTNLADVHGYIIREKKTAELAMSSPFGILALNDLIDKRMQIVNQRFGFHLKETASGKCDAKTSAKSNCNPRLYCVKCGYDCPAAVGVSFFDMSSIDNSDLQKEMNELQALRRKVLTASLFGESKFGKHLTS